MDEYYAELGIQNEKDFTKSKEEQYKTKKKVPKKVEVEPTKSAEASKKAQMIDNLISSARKEPNYKNVSRIIKIVRQLFNKE